MPEELIQEEFTFDPTLIESGDSKKEEEPKSEKLNLFKDEIFEDKEDVKLDDPNKVEDKTEDKEKEIEDKDAPDPDDDKKNEDDPSSKSVFSVVLGQDLMDRGILSSFNEEEIAKIAAEKGDAEAITAIMQGQAESIKEDIVKAYDDNYKEYLEMVKGGVSKQEATGIQQLESYSKSLDGIDLKSEEEASVEARKNLLTLNYRLTTKWSEDKIQKYVQKVYDEGVDIEEVDEAKKNVVDYIAEEKKITLDNAKAQEDKIKASREKLESDYKAQILKTEEYFKGEKVTKKSQSDIEDLIFTPVTREDGSPTNKLWAIRDKDPVKFDTKIAYMASIGYFDDKPLDKFIKSAKTKETSRLESYLSDNTGRNFMKSKGKSFSGESANKKDFLDF